MEDVKVVAKGWVAILMVYFWLTNSAQGEEASFTEADPFVCPHS